MSGGLRAEGGELGRELPAEQLPSSEETDEADARYVDEAEATAEGFVGLDELKHSAAE